jgi:PAS domain S-box-containing protein
MTQYRQIQNAWETDDRTAEQERRNRELFADLLERSSQPVGVGYPDGRLGLVNKAFEELTGYTADDLRSIDWVTILTPPEWLEIERQKLEELNQTGSPVRYEKEYIRKDGSRVPVEMLVHLATDTNGRPEFYYSFITDISERKHAEEALRESENRVRQKLESIFSPDGDLGVLELADILDIPAVQSLMNDFYKLAGIPMAIIDLKGNVLVGVGWQEICVRFHRSHPGSCQYCIESDLELTRGVAPGEFRLYRCKNNMWDIATPIMVGGQHVGNLFSGQFIFDDETPDYDLFRTQAKRYGFDEKAYIAALDRVKRISRESLDDAMSFFTKLADMLSKLSYGNISLAKSVAERDALVEAARQSEERFRVLAETIPGIVWIASPSGSVEWMNQRWSAYTGQKPDEALGWGWQSAMHPDDSASADVLWDEVQITGKVYEHEERIRSHDGEYRWFLARGLPVRDAEGKIVRWFGANTDINDLKETQRALEESEQRLNRSQEIAHLGSWELDLVRNKLTWSDEVYRIFGLEPQQFDATYEAFLEAVHPDDREAANEAYSGSLREGRDTYEIEHRVVRRSDGEIRIVRERCEHIRDGAGHIIRSVGMVHDITDSRNADQEIRELATRLDSHMENSPLAVVEWDADYRVIRWSDEATRVFGWTAQEMIGKRIDDLRWVHEEDWPIVARLMEDMNAGVRPRNINPNRNYCKDGSIIWCEWYNSILKDESGSVRSILSLVLDVTDRELAERDLARMRVEAEQRAAELESFVHSMADGVVLFDTEPRVLLANEAFKKVLGVPHGVPVEQWSRQYELQTLDGDPIPLAAWPSRRALNGEEIANERFKVVTPWRESITSMSGSPVRDARGTVIGGTMAFRDVTHLVELERQAAEIHEREHRIADILQKALIPEMTYDVPGCDIAVRYEPALKEAEVGGDFYDIFDLGDGKLAVLIGDVAGKGLAAAIRVAAARHSIRSYAFLDPRPSKVMTLANDALCRDDVEAGMLTAFLAIIDTRVGIVTYSSGGHEPPVVKRADGGTELLDVQGRVMGAAPDWAYPEQSRLLRPGDILMLVTDGITEARPDPLNLFGVEGVQDYLSRTQETSIEDIAEGLLEAAKKHAGGPLSDDAAIVAITLREGS